MQDYGTIYVIMPAYNVEKYIAHTFDSLLAQTYPNWKCLCMNDGSLDKTYDIMKSYANKDTRIQIFSQENQGVTKASNKLLENVEGPYLAYLDADDIIHPQMFEILLQNLIKENADVSEGTQVRCTDTPPSLIDQKLDPTSLSTTVLRDMSIFLTHKTSQGSWINKWNKIYRWDKVKQIRFSEKLIHEDDYWYNSLVNNNIQCKVLVNYPFYFYRQNPTSLCGHVNWVRYQQSGINRIQLSYDYFVKGNRLPDNKKEDFLYDLAQDAYRMIVRKPLKKGKNKELFDSAHQAIKNYLREKIINKNYLSLKQRLHIWFVIHKFRIASILLAKLT